MVTLCRNPTWGMEGRSLEELESKLRTRRDRHSETRLPRQTKPLDAHRILDKPGQMGRGGNLVQRLVVGLRE